MTASAENPQSDLCDLSAAALAAGYRSGDFTPVDALDSVAARIEACEPVINALWAPDLDGARREAEESAARWAAGEERGLLDGVPATVKENIARVGVPMPAGHNAGTPPIAAADAPITARLREAGAVVFASTVMPDWGMLSSGVSSRHGITRSPIDPTKTTGGSSSGAGAAAAAGYGPIHIGSDIGGSIRLPGTWLGLAALKPSFGRVPLDVPYMGRCAGPLARRPEDVRAAMEVIARPDARDYTQLPPHEGDYSCALQASGLRVGLLLDAGCGDPVDPDVAAVVRRAAEALAAAGAEVVELDSFMDDGLLADVDRFWRVRSWNDYAALSVDDQRKVLPHVARWSQRGADVSGAEILRCYGSIQTMRQRAVAATEPFDLVLSPVAPMAAFPAESPMPFDDPDSPMVHIGFTVPYNMSGQPAMSVHAGETSDGRTVGVQVSGRRFADAEVMAGAELLTELLGVAAPARTVGV